MSEPIKPIDPEKMRAMEMMCREIGTIIGTSIDEQFGRKKIGFALLIFAFDGSEFTWLSNAERDGMILLLQEAVNRLRGEAPTTSAERN